MIQKINSGLLLFLFYSSLFVTELPGTGLRKPITSILVPCFLLLWYELSRWIIRKHGRNGSKILIGSLLLVIVHICMSQFVESELFAQFGTAALFCGGTALGMILAKSVQHPSELIPILVTASAADISSAYWGPTKHFSEQLTQFYSGVQSETVPLVDYFIVKMPVVFSADELPLFGVTDWIFVSLLMAVLFKFKIAKEQKDQGSALRFPTEAIPVFALFSAIMLAWFGDSFITGIPVITLLFLGIIIPTNPEMRKISAQSVRYTLLFPLGIAVATAVKQYFNYSLAQ